MNLSELDFAFDCAKALRKIRKACQELDWHLSPGGEEAATYRTAACHLYEAANNIGKAMSACVEEFNEQAELEGWNREPGEEP